MELRRVNNNLEGIKSLLNVSSWRTSHLNLEYICMLLRLQKNIYPTSGTPGGWKGRTCKYCLLGSCRLWRCSDYSYFDFTHLTYSSENIMTFVGGRAQREGAEEHLQGRPGEVMTLWVFFIFYYKSIVWLLGVASFNFLWSGFWSLMLGFDFEGSSFWPVWADEFIIAPGYPTEVSSQVRHHMEGEFSSFLNFSKLIRFPNPEWVGKRDY